MKTIMLIALLIGSLQAQAQNPTYQVAQGHTVNLDVLQKSILGELQMACNAELDTSNTCRIQSFQISGMRPFYNLQGRQPASEKGALLHIIDIKLNSQLVRCNVEFSTESKTIDLKECESSSLMAKLFEQIINVDFKQAGWMG